MLPILNTIMRTLPSSDSLLSLQDAFLRKGALVRNSSSGSLSGFRIVRRGGRSRLSVTVHLSILCACLLATGALLQLLTYLGSPERSLVERQSRSDTVIDQQLKHSAINELLGNSYVTRTPTGDGDDNSSEAAAISTHVEAVLAELGLTSSVTLGSSRQLQWFNDNDRTQSATPPSTSSGKPAAVMVPGFFAPLRTALDQRVWSSFELGGAVAVWLKAQSPGRLADAVPVAETKSTTKQPWSLYRGSTRRLYEDGLLVGSEEESTSFQYEEQCPSADDIRVLVAVVTRCCDTQSRQKRMAIRRTWGSSVRSKYGRNMVMKYVVGQPDPSSIDSACDVLTDEVEEEGDMVVVPGLDAYRNLSNKTLRVLEYGLLSPCNFTHIMKIDDDTYLRPAQLLKVLKETGRSGRQDLYLGAKAGKGNNTYRVYTPNRDPKHRWYLSEEELPLSAEPQKVQYHHGWAYVLSRKTAARVVGKAIAIEAALKHRQMDEQLPSDPVKEGREPPPPYTGSLHPASPETQALEGLDSVSQQVEKSSGGGPGETSSGDQLQGLDGDQDGTGKGGDGDQAGPGRGGDGEMVSDDRGPVHTTASSMVIAPPSGEVSTAGGVIPPWWGILPWEDVMVGALLKGEVEITEHHGFLQAHQSCSRTMVVKHLDNQALALLDQMHSEEHQPKMLIAGRMNCTVPGYRPNSMWSWKKWRNSQPDVLVHGIF